MLARIVVAAGTRVLISFDLAFLAFHLVAGPQGNFAFDSGSARLVQLFPEQFWSDTRTGMAPLLIAVVVVTTTLALRRATMVASRDA